VRPANVALLIRPGQLAGLARLTAMRRPGYRHWHRQIRALEQAGSPPDLMVCKDLSEAWLSPRSVRMIDGQCLPPGRCPGWSAGQVQRHGAAGGGGLQVPPVGGVVPRVLDVAVGVEVGEVLPAAIAAGECFVSRISNGTGLDDTPPSLIFCRFQVAWRLSFGSILQGCRSHMHEQRERKRPCLRGN